MEKRSRFPLSLLKAIDKNEENLTFQSIQNFPNVAKLFYLIMHCF